MSEYGFEQRSFQTNGIRLIVICLSLAVICVWAIVLSPDHGGFFPATFHKDLRVDFINVGQGDAILVRTPKGKNFLIDGGMSVPPAQAKNENRELVQNYLRRNGIRSLDGIVVTHFHNDHLGGIIPLLKQMKVAQIWDPGNEFSTQTYKDYLELLQKKRIPRKSAKAGDALDWGEEISVVVLHPSHSYQGAEFSTINNTSVTLLIRYGNCSFLTTGDIEEDAQAELAQYGEALRAAVLKIPHHGSDTSLHRTFLDLVSPEYGIIMVGRGNPFGHPKQSMLSLYLQKGVKIFRTDHHGTIRLTMGGKDPKDFSLQVDRNP
jgi:competence protein ComEC